MKKDLRKIYLKFTSCSVPNHSLLDFFILGYAQSSCTALELYDLLLPGLLLDKFSANIFYDKLSDICYHLPIT